MGESGKRFMLTKRENEIFKLLIVGCSTDEIATKLGIKAKTVCGYISNTIQKLGVSNRKQAIAELLKSDELNIYK